jgi:hypothetical protein
MVAFSRLYIKPDVGFTTTVCTNCMTFGFAVLFLHNFWHNLLGILIDQCTGDNHFRFITAVGALAYMFEFLLCHFLYLYFSELLDTYDLINYPWTLA